MSWEAGLAPGLFYFGPGQAVGKRRSLLSESSKKSREQAEASFSKTQTQFLTRTRILSEQDAASDAREAKTARLRELRMDKEAEDLAQAGAKPATKGKR